jgi:hypothetical protein
MIIARLDAFTAHRGRLGVALLLLCFGPSCTEENPGFVDDPGDMSTSVLDGTPLVDQSHDIDATPDNGGSPDLPGQPDLPLSPDSQPPDLTPIVDNKVVTDLPTPQDYALPDLPPPDLPPPDKALPKPDIKVLLKTGSLCTIGTQCMTGFCVDKVCCSGPCKAKCMACHLKGNIGKCTFLPSGTDMNNDCKTVDKVSTCKLDGTCNGKGGCRFYPKGTVCVAARCAGAGTAIGVRLCDGGGACLAGTQTKCFPYNCDKTTTKCYTSCTKAKEINICSGYFGCDATTSTCNKSCLNDSHCNKNGECDKGKCEKD